MRPPPYNYAPRTPWWECHRWLGMPVRAGLVVWWLAKRALVLVRGV